MLFRSVSQSRYHAPIDFSWYVCIIRTEAHPPFGVPVAIQITPDLSHPVPSTFADEVSPSLKKNVRAMADTAAVVLELGYMPFEMTQEDEEAARKLFQEFDTKKTEDANPPELYQGNVAIKLSALLSMYDKQIVNDAVQLRTYITNRLLEVSNCGCTKYELRALELLGKMSDVGVFTEKSEISIVHKSADDLRVAIADKISKLLGSDIVEVEAVSVYDELGGLNGDIPRNPQGRDSTET